jgi:hypothetical protein
MPNYFHLLAPVKRIAAMTLWLAVYMLDFFCIVWIQQLSYPCHSSLYNNVKVCFGHFSLQEKRDCKLFAQYVFLFC